MTPSVQQTQAPELYLDLMKKCLTRYLFLDEELWEVTGWGWRRKVFAPVSKLLSSFGFVLARRGGTHQDREFGLAWPGNAETMAGMKRLDNVHECVTAALRDGVPGDLIETGVWRGGTTIFMRAVLAAYGDDNRRVWVADSFQGLPKPDPKFYAGTPMDVSFPWLKVSLEEVKANFEKYGLLDAQVQFLPGWFKDTLPSAPIEKLAVARLDGDLYESTIDAMRALYPKLSVGGYLIVDDYGSIDECRQAITDYRNEHRIDEKIEIVDSTAVYWKKLR